MLFVSHKCYGRHVTADHPRKFSIEFLPGLTVDAACRVTIRRVDGTRDEPPYSEVLRVTLESVSWEWDGDSVHYLASDLPEYVVGMFEQVLFDLESENPC